MNEMRRKIEHLLDMFEEYGELENAFKCLNSFFGELEESECGESWGWFEFRYKRNCKKELKN